METLTWRIHFLSHVNFKTYMTLIHDAFEAWMGSENVKTVSIDVRTRKSEHWCIAKHFMQC
jgi:hypothetical protein